MEDVGRGKRPATSHAKLLPPLLSASDEQSHIGEEGDEKVEQFFQLIKSIKAMKEQLRASSFKKPRTTTTEAELMPWKPAFEWEDFAVAEECKRKRTATTTTEVGATIGGGDRKGKKVMVQESATEEREGASLELRLAL